MKRLFQVMGIIVLSIFSFYYTNEVVELSKKNDPIMLKITEEKAFLETSPVNAIISSDTMLVGKSGKSIDIDSSYEKMKKTRGYNKALLDYIDVKPSIKKKDNYDKPIRGVNTNLKEISLVFKIDDKNYLKQIEYILDKNSVIATFFIDGKYLEDENLKFKNNIGLYSYNNSFTSVSASYMKNYLPYIYNYSNYCLYKNEEFLSVCKNAKISTIKPTLVERNLYNYFKANKEKGIIYEVKVTKDNIKQLNSTLIYLKSKGYDIMSLDQLLKE